MKFKTLLPALALSVSAFSAQAVAVNWAAHDPVEVGAGFATGSFASLLDTFSFTLAAPSTVTYTTVTNDFGFLDLTGSVLNLYSGMVGSGTLVATQSFDTVQTQGASVLGAGAYYYEVKSTVAPNAFAGSYTLTSTVSAVPEPQSLALMLGGLLALAMLASRRSGQR